MYELRKFKPFYCKNRFYNSMFVVLNLKKEKQNEKEIF